MHNCSIFFSLPFWNVFAKISTSFIYSWNCQHLLDRPCLNFSGGFQGRIVVSIWEHQALFLCGFVLCNLCLNQFRLILLNWLFRLQPDPKPLLQPGLQCGLFFIFCCSISQDQLGILLPATLLKCCITSYSLCAGGTLSIKIWYTSWDTYISVCQLLKILDPIHIPMLQFI